MNPNNKISNISIPATSIVWLALIILPILVVASIWLPFGFKLTGVIEEWDVINIFTNHYLFFIVNAHTPLAPHMLRPLTIFPHALAYWFDPDSFNSWHLLLILLLIMKGTLSGQLIWKATGSLRFAMIMAVLVMIYPADTMQLSFRSIHVNCALSLLLLASYLFVIACEKKSAFSYFFSISAALLLFVANCMYEATFTLLFFPLLVLFVKEGAFSFFHKLRQNKNHLFIWFAGSILYVTYIIWASSQIHSYQATILGEGNPIKTHISLFPKLFTIGMFRSLIGGWFDAIKMVAIEFSNYIYLVSATAIIFGAMLLTNRKSCNEHLTLNTIRSTQLLACRLAIAGLLLLVLGYIPFLSSFSHVYINQRTFLCATPGAAMVCVALLMMISRLSIWLSRFLICLLIFFGLGAQLFQFHHYINIAEVQRKLLGSIVENFDGNIKNKILVVFDETNRINRTYMFLLTGTHRSLNYSLSYLYGHPIVKTEVCSMPGKEWQLGDSMGRTGICLEDNKHWIFRSPPVVHGPNNFSTPTIPDVKIPKKQAITLTIHQDYSVSSNSTSMNYKEKLLKENTTVARRYRNVILQKPWRFNIRMFKDQSIIKDYYKWSFGNWWSLELPIHGSGWREAEWHVGQLHHRAAAWKSQERATLYFEFFPTQQKYLLQGKFNHIASTTIQQSIKIRLNGHLVSYQWAEGNKFEAVISSQNLLSGTNVIEFDSKVDTNYYGLSAQLAWFEVKAEQP